MSNFGRRIRKLEAQLTDSSGLVPHSPAWMDYWMKEVDQVLAENGPGPRKLIPLEAFRAWIQAQPDSDANTTSQPDSDGEYDLEPRDEARIASGSPHRF
jgi:hypothetical protein